MSATGEKGAKKLLPADPTTAAGVFYMAITAVQASAITAKETPIDVTNGDTTLSTTLGAGTTIVGTFSEIDLSSGEVRAYLK